MSNLWHYEHDGQQLGPVSPETLKRLARAGQITPTDLIWQEGTDRKVPASRAKGLFPSATPTPKPIPVATPISQSSASDEEPPPLPASVDEPPPVPAAVDEQPLLATIVEDEPPPLPANVEDEPPLLATAADEPPPIPAIEDEPPPLPAVDEPPPLPAAGNAPLLPMAIEPLTAIKSYFGKVKKAFNDVVEEERRARICPTCGGKKKMAMGKCQRCTLKTIGLVNSPTTGYVFSQSATYYGGISDFPTKGSESGFAFVYEDFCCFFDNRIRWKVLHGQIIKAELDFFQASGFMTVSPFTTASVQRVRNIVAITCVVAGGGEQTVRFQIHGAFSLYAEEPKAMEFLNHLLRFKGKFVHSRDEHKTGDDAATKLEKLVDMKNKGLITESEYEATRKRILDTI